MAAEATSEVATITLEGAKVLDSPLGKFVTQARHRLHEWIEPNLSHGWSPVKGRMHDADHVLRWLEVDLERREGYDPVPLSVVESILEARCILGRGKFREANVQSGAAILAAIEALNEALRCVEGIAVPGEAPE